MKVYVIKVGSLYRKIDWALLAIVTRCDKDSYQRETELLENCLCERKKESISDS